MHITEGNGGVPGQGMLQRNTLGECSNPDLFPMCGNGNSYGRLIASNASVLTYEHVENPTSKVTDVFHIMRTWVIS